MFTEKKTKQEIEIQMTAGQASHFAFLVNNLEQSFCYLGNM